MSVYVIEEQGDTFSTQLAPVAYRTFEQAKAYITARAMEEGWKFLDDFNKPEPDFEEDNDNRYTAGRARPVEFPVGKTYIWAHPGDEREIPIIIHKLTLEDPVGPDGGTRRKTRRQGSSKSLKQRLAAAKKKCSPGYDVYDYRKNSKGEFFNCLPAGLKRRRTRKVRRTT